MMGLNTAALILNDAMHSIEADDQIGSKINQAIYYDAGRGGGDVSANGHAGAIRVLPSQHADCVQIVAIGGNSIRKLGYSWKWEPEDLLRDLAEQLGYTLRKLPTPHMNSTWSER